MPVAQINARIDAIVKREGDATLSRFGVGATEAIRALWDYLASAQTLPSYMMQDKRHVEHPSTLPRGGEGTGRLSSEVAERGAGLAIRLASERGLVVSQQLDIPYEDLRELAFDELIAEGRAHV